MSDEKIIEPLTLTESKEFTPVVVEDNIYNAKVTALKPFSGVYGESLAIVFEILDGPEKGKCPEGVVNLKKMTKKAKLYRWAKALKCPIPENVGESFDPNTLMGCEGRILTSQREKEDNESKKYFQSFVKDILPKE